MLCAEWWAFEICALCAGILGHTELAAHTIVQNAIHTCFMIPFGIGVATTNRKSFSFFNAFLML